MASEHTRPCDVPHLDSRRRSSEQMENCEGRNLFLLALHQIAFCIGCVFKIENAIMPAVLDPVCGTGWIRGFLPILNRFGQSVPPLFAAAAMQRFRRKKRALAALPLLMSVPFLILGACRSRPGPG